MYLHYSLFTVLVYQFPDLSLVHNINVNEKKKKKSLFRHSLSLLDLILIFVTSDLALVNNTKPTSQGRLRYITRKISSNTFEILISKENCKSSFGKLWFFWDLILHADSSSLNMEIFLLDLIFNNIMISFFLSFPKVSSWGNWTFCWLSTGYFSRCRGWECLELGGS